MVVESILPHAECGPNNHRKDAPPFIILMNPWVKYLCNIAKQPPPKESFNSPLTKILDPRSKYRYGSTCSSVRISGYFGTGELGHKSLTPAHEFYIVPKLRFQPNLVPNSAFGTEVHSLVPKLHNIGFDEDWA